ncbi:hypothetical protein TNCV_2248421 [Trichonephila clavipes]|nr:hypothetical protein TNCV_2248421 [Trichonephila clavipes]
MQEKRLSISKFIVRVQYFVRGGLVGYRASSKHLSPHLPVDELDSSGVKKGLRCRYKMHVWVSGPQRSRLDVDVDDKEIPYVTDVALRRKKYEAKIACSVILSLIIKIRSAMVSLGHPSFLPTDLGRLDDEEASPGDRPLRG